MKHVDYAVIGAGPGGLTVAVGLALNKKDVLLIEKETYMGGDCTNVGCVPSKALLHYAKTHAKIHAKTDEKNTTMQAALDYVHSKRNHYRQEESPEALKKKYGVASLTGHARFVSSHVLDVNSTRIKAKKIIIATGSRPSSITIPGVDPDDILTNETIFEKDHAIHNLIIIGGGYIGCELGEALNGLGINVSIIQRNTHILPREDEDISQILSRYLSDLGIALYTNSTAQSAKVSKQIQGATQHTTEDKKENRIESRVESRIESKMDLSNPAKKFLIIQNNATGETRKLPYDKILIAAGRKANYESLDLAKAGVKTDTQGIIVDAYSRTNKKHIFAIGDCVSGNPKFTHRSNNEAVGVVRNILFPLIKDNVRKKVLPAVTYTGLEVATVGLTKKQLQKYFHKNEYITIDVPLKENDRSFITDQTQGLFRIHFSRLTGKTLGVSIIGQHAGELLALGTYAVQHKVSALRLMNQIFAYPTKSEIYRIASQNFVIQLAENIPDTIMKRCGIFPWMLSKPTHLRKRKKKLRKQLR